MEERDIRDIWKSGDQQQDAGLSEAEVDKIISQGPKNVIAKFIKTLRVEQWMNFIIFIGAMTILFIEQMWIAGWSMIVLNVLFFVYYKNLIERMDGEIVGNSVLDYLKTIHGHMKRFILHYKLASFVLILPAYVLAIYLGKYYKNDQQYDMISSLTQHELYFHVLALVLALVTALLLIHLLYGRKSVKINAMMKTLQEEES